MIRPSLARPTVLVGPEGGWTDAELARVEARVGLGPQVLRVETAAIAVGALLGGPAQRAGGPRTARGGARRHARV